jgi:hypothetical protein
MGPLQLLLGQLYQHGGHGIAPDVRTAIDLLQQYVVGTGTERPTHTDESRGGCG